MKSFSLEKNKLYRPQKGVSKGENGRVMIIGGSSLFHGAPLFSLKVAARVVDMVFFSSPEPSVGKVAENLKSKLFSFIWVPWAEAERYIEKADSILIGPGLMRYRKEGGEKNDEVGRETKRITEQFLQEFLHKQWVIDAGSLQVMAPQFIPKKAILTPNKKEYQMLFGKMEPEEAVKKYKCILVCKNSNTKVCSPGETQMITNGGVPLTKGGIGDVLAGLILALAAKNPPFLSACASSWLMMKAVDELNKKVGPNFSADDLADKVPEVLGKFFV
jgi:hydroxyethylthiazole kinase-like uncharacterized protein yjeF